MLDIGLDCARSDIARNLEEARNVVEAVGAFPLVIRPAFTLGGAGGGIAYNREELEEIVRRGLDLSPVCEVLIEESLLGWKEFEMEVMRDRADNCVVICSIENFDPMGVHTGDSITVAPVQTLTDKEYQAMRQKLQHLSENHFRKAHHLSKCGCVPLSPQSAPTCVAPGVGSHSPSCR